MNVDLEVEIEEFIRAKSIGALASTVLPSLGDTAHCVAWVYWENDYYLSSSSNEKLKGFAPSLHSSFDLYRKKKFIRRRSSHEDDEATSEDYLYFDVEADPKYENIRPGTVTIEGFGMECWAYRIDFGNHPEITYAVCLDKVPAVSGKTILRRIFELKHMNPNSHGWDLEGDVEYLSEFTSEDFLVGSYQPSYKTKDVFLKFYRLLNREEHFADFSQTDSIIVSLYEGHWKFLWQVILGAELARRLQSYPRGSLSGFTRRILTTLIVADQWINNGEIVFEEDSVEEQKAKQEESEAWKEKGNEAMKRKDYTAAIKFYTRAIDLIPKNPIFLSNRAAAYASKQEYTMALTDAQAAVDADPSYTKGWGRLGLAKLELGDFEGSMEAYKRGIEVDGKGGSVMMRQGYDNARKKVEALRTKMEGKRPTVGEMKLAEPTRQEKKGPGPSKESNSREDPWDSIGTNFVFRSSVHERQEEGLILFAEILKWPFLNETREHVKNAYQNYLNGSAYPGVTDWLFGLVLPGRFAAIRIMSALIQCTPSLDEKMGNIPPSQCGLSLPQQSYWRSRTVLGRVLGALPGNQSVCGWVVPCPPIDGPHYKYIRLNARRIALPRTKDNLYVDPLGPQPNERIQQWATELKDESLWAIPDPPVQRMTTCTLESIRVKDLPLSRELDAKRNKMTADEIEEYTEYRASITFKLDEKLSTTYILYTNPIFITAPACKTANGGHRVHKRELSKYQRNIWNVADLKDAKALELDKNGVIVINATGVGEETLARAWCSERARNAVIRASGGPCFTCAYKVASEKGLGVKVLIWVS